MSFDLVIVLATTLIVLILFVTEALRLDLVAMLAMTVLLVTGVLTPAEGFSGFANEATLTIAAMFVISEAFRRTGALNFIGERIGRLFSVNETLALMTMMMGVAVMSAFVNNTAVVAILLPIVISMCRRHSISPTRVLMPLSFAAMFGGLCTVIGTSTNILVSSILVERGMRGIGMFETTVPGLIFFLVGTAYMITIGRWLVPARGADTDLADDYEMACYLAEVEIGPDCSACKQRLSEVEFLNSNDMSVLTVLREDRHMSAWEDPVLRPGDLLRVRGTLDELREVARREDIAITPITSSSAGHLGLPELELELFEAVVAPDSMLAGHSLEEIEFSAHFAANILAIRSRGQLRHRRLTQERLRGGDVLLMEAPSSEVARMQQHPAFVVVSEIAVPAVQRHMVVPVVLVIAMVVTFSALGILPIVVTSVAGAVILCLMGVIDVEGAYEAIDWQVILLLAGLLPLGVAMEQTGAAAYVAEGMTTYLGAYGPLALLAGVYLATTLMTDLMSNQATAILITPIAVGAAISTGAEPRVFAMAIAFAASASFASPVGYQTNTLIYGAGDYRFIDFVKVGLPLNLLFWGVAVFYLPTFWPF